jgi:hypothetical protein
MQQVPEEKWLLVQQTQWKRQEKGRALALRVLYRYHWLQRPLSEHYRNQVGLGRFIEDVCLHGPFPEEEMALEYGLPLPGHCENECC